MSASTTRALPVLLLLAAAIGPGRAAAAPDDAAALLAKLDAALMQSNNQFLVWEMKSVEPGKPDRVMEFEVHIKGKHWRRIAFTAPADLKGMNLLIRSPTQMYIYLPQFNKVRRVASHVQDQGFMGTAFDYDEVSLAVFGELFAAERMADKGTHWNLVLARKPDQSFRHAAIDLDLRKDGLQPFALRYQNEQGKTVKTESRSEFACSGTFCTPRKVVMVDHTRKDLTTTLTLKKFKMDPNTPDEFFTVRALQQE